MANYKLFPGSSRKSYVACGLLGPRAVRQTHTDSRPRAEMWRMLREFRTASGTPAMPQLDIQGNQPQLQPPLPFHPPHFLSIITSHLACP